MDTTMSFDLVSSVSLRLMQSSAPTAAWQVHSTALRSFATPHCLQRHQTHLLPKVVGEAKRLNAGTGKNAEKKGATSTSLLAVGHSEHAAKRKSPSRLWLHSHEHWPMGHKTVQSAFALAFDKHGAAEYWLCVSSRHRIGASCSHTEMEHTGFEITWTKMLLGVFRQGQTRGVPNSFSFFCFQQNFYMWTTSSSERNQFSFS